jgi:hypothetical protein
MDSSHSEQRLTRDRPFVREPGLLGYSLLRRHLQGPKLHTKSMYWSGLHERRVYRPRLYI